MNTTVSPEVGLVVMQGIHAHTCYLNGDVEAELTALEELERLADELTLDQLFEALRYISQSIASKNSSTH